MDEIKIAEKLGKIESTMKAQNELLKEVRSDIRKLSDALTGRIEANGKQDVYIATLDQRLAHIEKSLQHREWRIWSALIAALGALIESLASRFFR